MPDYDLSNISGFEWDKGNVDKSYQKHGITMAEAEEIFLDNDLQVIKDIKHSQKEERFIVLGKTFLKRILFAVFTLRNGKIRFVSARLANRKERLKYGQKPKKNSTI